MNLLSEVHAMTDEEHRLLNEFVSDLYGISFPPERRGVFETRLKPRLQALDMNRFMDYYLRLQYAYESEVSIFTRLVTNNESYFFRETRQFETVFDDAWPELLRGLNNGGPIRALCAGCSSGEEPYTLKIYSENNSSFGPRVSIDIHGFDIDSERIERAHSAEYGRNSLRSTNEDQIRRFFSRTGSDLYGLNNSLREGVSFSIGNILDLASYPAQKYDVLFCRNVLIYFSERALHRSLENFARALRPGGLLFLGHSESIIGLSDVFETARFERCIGYRRKQ